MDIRQLEYAAEILFALCAEHPEICPHDYEWTHTMNDHNTGVTAKTYTCKLCRNKRIVKTGGE